MEIVIRVNENIETRLWSEKVRVSFWYSTVPSTSYASLVGFLILLVASQSWFLDVTSSFFSEFGTGRHISNAATYCTVYSSQSIEVCLTEMEWPCVDCIDKREYASGYNEWIAYYSMSKWRQRLGLSLKYHKREINEFWMMRQKLKEAVQTGVLTVQYNSGDVKSRVSMDAELKINLLLTSRLEISSVTPRSILENPQVTHRR